jgi:hypothetical protein
MKRVIYHFVKSVDKVQLHVSESEGVGFDRE